MQLFRMVLFVLFFIPYSLFSAVNTETTNNQIISEDSNYPLIITDSKNRDVTITSEPKTVISVAPSITETIYSLEAGEIIVGRTDFCDYPPEVNTIPSIGTLYEPNIEKIVELNPDILFASTHFQNEILQKLEEANITVIIIQEEGTLEGVFSGISQIGKIINKKKKANLLIKDMKARIDIVKNSIPDNKPTVYYVVGFGEYGDYTAGGDTFISQLIELAGGINLAKESIGWTYSLEKIIEGNPDIVICSEYYGTPEEIKKATGYKDLPAIQNGNLYPIDNNLLDRAGPRVVEGIEALYEIFYK